MIPKSILRQQRRRKVLMRTARFGLRVGTILLVVLILGGYDMLRPTSIPCEVMQRLSGGHIFEPCSEPGICDDAPTITIYGKWCTNVSETDVMTDTSVPASNH